MDDYEEDDAGGSYVKSHHDVEEIMRLMFIAVFILAAMTAIGFWFYKQNNGITHAEYLRIQEGMTYDQVLTIAGEAPDGISSSTVMGVTVDEYSWRGEGPAGYTIIGFMDGKVISKTML